MKGFQHYANAGLTARFMSLVGASMWKSFQATWQNYATEPGNSRSVAQPQIPFGIEALSAILIYARCKQLISNLIVSKIKT